MEVVSLPSQGIVPISSVLALAGDGQLAWLGEHRGGARHSRTFPGCRDHARTEEPRLFCVLVPQPSA